MPSASRRTTVNPGGAAPGFPKNLRRNRRTAACELYFSARPAIRSSGDLQSSSATRHYIPRLPPVRYSMNRLPFIVPALIVTLLGLGACGGDGARTDEEPAEALPHVRVDTHENEGQLEPGSLQLVCRDALRAALHDPVGYFGPALAPGRDGYELRLTQPR